MFDEKRKSEALQALWELWKTDGGERLQCWSFPEKNSTLNTGNKEASWNPSRNTVASSWELLTDQADLRSCGPLLSRGRLPPSAPRPHRARRGISSFSGKWDRQDPGAPFGLIICVIVLIWGMEYYLECLWVFFSPLRNLGKDTMNYSETPLCEASCTKTDNSIEITVLNCC